MTPEHIMPEDHGEQRPETPSGERPEKRLQRKPARSRGEKPQRPPSGPSEEAVPEEVNEVVQPENQPNQEGAAAEDQVSQAPEAEGDLPHPFEDFLSNSPEEDRMQRLEAAEDLMDHTKSSGQLFDAAKKMGVPPDELESMLRAAGHTDEEKIAEVVDRKDELAPDASQIDQEPPTEEQQSRRELAEEFVKDAKDLQALAQTGADVSEAKAALEVKARGWLANWRDENPGTWNQINRGIVRPGVIILLLVGLFYLMCVSGVTAGAARKVGK